MKFFSTFLATLLAFFTGMFLLFLFFAIIIASGSSQPEPYIRKGSVLTIDMSGSLTERAPSDPLQELFAGPGRTPVSLETLESVLEKAASDERIEGIWMEMGFVSSSWAHLARAHELLTKFKESGKFIYASVTDPGIDEPSYYLATTADSIFAPGEAYFEFNGFVAQISYYSDLLEKIGVEPEIFRVGRYKSAVEPWLLTESSPESREQLQILLDEAKREFLDKVSAKTGAAAAELDAQMDGMYTGDMRAAFDAGLIDVEAAPFEMTTHLLSRLGKDADDDLETVSYSRYARVSPDKAGLPAKESDNRIAVIHAEGAIMPELDVENPFMGSTISYTKIAEILDDLDEDKDVKAIVLHIDSPGGSATTSDLIWQRLRRSAEKKPIIAVMGSVAASGGYYIAMGADTVVAAPNTITGSIGIFRTMFNAEELMNDRLGITFSEIQTDPHADVMQMTRPLTEAERRAMQLATEKGYERFLKVVATSRGMERDEVHEVAQGRVWTGKDAHAVGLVDVLGTLQTGLDLAAEKAGIDTYTIDRYPKPEDVFEAILGSGGDAMLRWSLGWMPQPVKGLFELAPAGQAWETSNRNMALLPYRIDLR